MCCAATFTEIIPVKRQTGTEYDFIEKKVRPVFEYDYEERQAGTLRLRTDDLGAFAGSIPAADTDHDDRIDLSLTDPDGHPARTISHASVGFQPLEDTRFPNVTLSPTVDSEDGGPVWHRRADRPDDARPGRHGGRR